MCKLQDKEYILSVLQEYKEFAEKQGLNVYAIGLKGSQNYNLTDEESDIDANLVFIPTVPQLRKGDKFKFKFETGEVTCHNIYEFSEIVAKGNPQWIEVCNSDYTIGSFDLWKHYELNPSALKGMLMEKVTAFSKLYPSRASVVEKYGYDVKQLSSIIRLVHLLERNYKIFKYSDEEREFMMKVKRGILPGTLIEAWKMRDEYVSRLSSIYEEKKLQYTPQKVNYNELDEIVKQSLST